MKLPASEINYWREYYSIFPLPQEREDARTALLAQVISNMSGRMLRDMYLRKIGDFLPDYLDGRKMTEAELIDAEKAFVAEALQKGAAVMEGEK